jgi:hypothetical protein
MNFNSLVNKLEILEEAKAGRFDKLFNTGYLKKAIEDKKIGVARPIVFEFIINFLKDKGMVPDGTAFAGSRYAAEAGEFIKNLVDSGVIKDEIADEFKQYMDKELSRFLQIKQQVRSRGKGENIGKSFSSKEEFEQFGKVKTPEEMAAEKQAAKVKKQGGDRMDLNLIDAAEQGLESGLEDAMDDSEIWSDQLQNYIETDIIKYIENIEDKTTNPKQLKKLNDLRTLIIQALSQAESYIEFKYLLDSKNDPFFGNTDKQGTVLYSIWSKVVLPVFIKSVKAATADISKAPKPKAKPTRSGLDDLGLGTGDIAQDDSARRLANPFEDEEVPVTENTKPKVKYTSNKDLKVKTYWQKMAQQEMYYR